MKLRLLIGDDEELARASLRKMLDSFFDEFSQIAEAERGDEVVESARRFRPDLILLDIRMPGLNGLDAAAQILTTNPDARIVIVTAYDRFSLAQRAVNLGLDGYLLKPVIEAEFRRIVADVIKRIERGSRRNRATEVIDQGPLAAPDLAAFEDRLIRSLLRGRLPAPAEAAAELIAAWEKKGLAVEQRLRSFAFALAREAERCAGAGGIVDEVTRGLPPDALIGGGEARDALVELLVAWASPSAAESGETGPRILDWLSETPLADLSLDALAERLRMSPASASRLFRDRIGKSFTAYASALRMERAVTIASSGEEFTLEELSRRVGYGDSAYFGRLFKEHTGLSPREYAREFARMNRQG